MDVAVVDYQSPDAPKRFTESLRNTGFAVLTHHPIQYDMVQRLQNEWLNFFALVTSGITCQAKADKTDIVRLKKLSRQLVHRFPISKSIFTGIHGVVSQLLSLQVRPLCIKQAGRLLQSC